MAGVLTRDLERFSIKAPHLRNAAELEFVVGDFKGLSAENLRYDYALHAATETSRDNAQIDPLALLERNIEGTRRFLQLVRSAGVRKFIFTSSGAVYGEQPSDLPRIAEHHRYAPDPVSARSAYGESKRISELLCALESVPGKCEGKIARCFAFVGPHLALSANYAIGNFLGDALRGGPLKISGDGTPRRSYLYAADLAVWLWTLLFRGQSGQAYNVGAEEDYSILEVASTVRDVVCPNAQILLAKAPATGMPISRYVPDTTKARAEFRLEARVALVDALGRTAAWHRHS